MSDIAIVYDQGCLTTSIENGDLKVEQGLETAVLLSLSTNRRADEYDDLGLFESRQGWWADTLSENEGDKIGSKFWLLANKKIENSTLVFCETYASEALEWMLEDGVASNVDVTASFSDTNAIDIAISITKPDGEQNLFSVYWDGQELKRSA